MFCDICHRTLRQGDDFETAHTRRGIERGSTRYYIKTTHRCRACADEVEAGCQRYRDEMLRQTRETLARMGLDPDAVFAEAAKL